MAIYNLGSDRMVCWDEFLVDKIENAEVRMHKPVKREKVFTCDKFWEGSVCGYASVIKLGDTYRMYYRAQNLVCKPDGTMDGNRGSFCIAESNDGLNFTRKEINKHDYYGITENNIFLNQGRDNFAVIYDENPDCPKEEKFKALSMGGGDGYYKDDGGPHGVYMFVSADGIDFKLKGRLPIPGSFDSYNTIVWDKETKQYFIYTRGEHLVGGGDAEFDVVNKARAIFREVRVTTTKDFVNFEHHGELNYGEDNIPMQFYTNQIQKYYRAKDLFIGFPARYIDRWEDEDSFRQMPLAERHDYVTKFWKREGTAITDCAIITSRDGKSFNKWDEAYLTPGIEAECNWWYGNCYTVYGMHEMPSGTPGAPNEIAFYMPDNYRIKALDFYRYTTRLDGFFSWYARYRGGTILTKPFTFEGNELEINFSTSALGDIIITVCDENGNELDGYRSIKIFGDSVKRRVDFEKELSALNGKPVKLKIELHDCDLYSFKFN